MERWNAGIMDGAQGKSVKGFLVLIAAHRSDLVRVGPTGWDDLDPGSGGNIDQGSGWGASLLTKLRLGAASPGEGSENRLPRRNVVTSQ